MPRYEVWCSIGGSLVFIVEAANEDEAIEFCIEGEAAAVQHKDDTYFTGLTEVKELGDA